MKNRNLAHSDNWATPKAFYDALDSEFHFDYDPCPLNGTGGLEGDWKSRDYINPPYSRKLKEAFVKKQSSNQIKESSVSCCYLSQLALHSSMITYSPMRKRYDSFAAASAFLERTPKENT